MGMGYDFDAAEADAAAQSLYKPGHSSGSEAWKDNPSTNYNCTVTAPLPPASPPSPSLPSLLMLATESNMLMQPHFLFLHNTFDVKIGLQTTPHRVCALRGGAPWDQRLVSPDDEGSL